MLDAQLDHMFTQIPFFSLISQYPFQVFALIIFILCIPAIIALAVKHPESEAILIRNLFAILLALSGIGLIIVPFVIMKAVLILLDKPGKWRWLTE